MGDPGAPIQQAKLVLLGDMGAGKSSLVLRFVKGQFFDYQESTIGAAFLTKTIPEKGVKFEIWGAAAAVVVFDITNAESFAKAKNWVKELQRQGNPNMIMALAGNKADLAAQRSVTADEAKAYADENSLFFWETSAKTNVNVAEVFNDIAERLPRAAAAAAPQQPTGGITLTEPAPEQKKKSSCCSTA